MSRPNGMRMSAARLVALCAVLFMTVASAAEEPAKVVFVLDASGSMWGQIEGTAKIVIAKKVLNDLIDGLPQEMQVGLFAYGHRTKGDCQDIEMLVPVGPLDRKALKARIAALNAKGKTPLSAAVQQAAKALRYTEEKATVILVSDGLETCHADPCGLAAELAMSGVDFTVHVVGFDVTKEEQAQLRCLADKTGGLFLAAGNAQSLRDALTQTVAKSKEPPKPVVEDPGTAKLTAPASVPAGSEFEVQWQGPDSRNDYIAIARKDHKDRAYRHYVYTEKGNPACLRAPGDTGDHELRYVHAQTGKVIGKADIKVTPVEASLKPPASAQVAREFDVAWEGPDYEGDYIAICRPEDPDDAYQNYSYTRGGHPARLRAPSDAGTYEVRYIMATDTKVLARALVAIEGVGAKVEVPEFVDMAAEFEVRWQGPNNPGDYISIALPGGDGNAYKAYTYTKQGTPLKLRAPSDPGQYEVRYILDQGRKILARTPITVLGVVAYVEPPESAAAAAQFEVRWQGPNNPGDYISIALPGSDGNAYKAYTYTKQGTPLKLRAPSDPGPYEVRYVLNQGNKILAKAPITIQAVTAQVQAPESAAAAAQFEVSWQGPNNPGDYISIALPGSEGNAYKAYTYTREGTPLKLRAPSDPGPYEVRYILDQGRKILARAPISIQAVTAQVQAPESADVGAEFEVSWQGPDNSGDYISIALPGGGGSDYAGYTYTREGTPLKLRAPSDPGPYEVRYILDQGRKILARAPITIQAVSATVSAPAEVAAGAEILVAWQGPNYDGDYVTIVPAGADDSEYTSYFYTRDGSPGKLEAPSEPGTYEVRYILDQGRKALGRTRITVK
ncbi:MAG: VWA domain-containing protein [bacterium]